MTTKLRLFAESAGYCQNPSCQSLLFIETTTETIHIAEIAHVISAEDRGPRAVTSMSPSARASFDNLILLCPTCHTIIDKAEESYPEELIQSWKSEHRNKIVNIFSIKQYSLKQDVRLAIEPCFRENKTIFDTYGPETADRFNPESTLPAQWKRKIRDNILPNNRKILAICEANAHLLNTTELDILENYRQHVFDFEAKHIEEVEENGMQFPIEVLRLFI